MSNLLFLHFYISKLLNFAVEYKVEEETHPCSDGCAMAGVCQCSLCKCCSVCEQKCSECPAGPALSLDDKVAKVLGLGGTTYRYFLNNLLVISSDIITFKIFERRGYFYELNCPGWPEKL